MSSTKRFMTSREVAELFGVGDVAAWRMMRQGRVPCISVGRKLYADRVALDAMIAEQTEARRAR